GRTSHGISLLLRRVRRRGRSECRADPGFDLGEVIRMRAELSQVVCGLLGERTSAGGFGVELHQDFRQYVAFFRQIDGWCANLLTDGQGSFGWCERLPVILLRHIGLRLSKQRTCEVRVLWTNTLLPN